MKNRLTIISRVSITAIALGSLSFAWSAAGQNRSPSRTDSSASLSAKDKTSMRNAAKGGMMEVALGKLASEKGPKRGREEIWRANGHRSLKGQ